MKPAIGPLPCLTCRQLVAWFRDGRAWRLMDPTGKEPHKCNVVKAA